MASFFYICEYLEISPQEFFEFDSKNPIKLDELIEYMKKLDDFQLDNLTGLVKGLIK